MPLPAKMHMITYANAHTFTQLCTYAKIFFINKSITNLFWLTVIELQNIIGLLIWGVTVRTCCLCEYQKGENACHDHQKMICTGTVSHYLFQRCDINDLSLEDTTSLIFLYLPIISLTCGSINTGYFGVALKIQVSML